MLLLEEERTLALQASAEEGGGGDAEAGLRGSSTAKLMYERLRRQRENSHGLQNDSPYERALTAMYQRPPGAPSQRVALERAHRVTIAVRHSLLRATRR